MIPRNVTSALRRSIRPKPNTLWKGDRICRSWRTNSTLEKGIAQKPYYVTTPIFYVNAAPHVGHLYTMVLSDILKRWQVLKGKEAILCTGTDEHGMKIQQAAAKADTPPKEFCDQNAEIFKLLASRAGLSNDHFIRTTDDDHKEAVQYFWQMLQDREYIYESKHEGWYCVSDETFYPELAIEKRLDPFTGRAFMASKETGKEVEWTSEKNYHFRLSAFKDQLLEFYKKNPKFVVPATRMNDVVKWVSEGLEDLSVSRPVERLSWGIRVPDDETQTIYVWLDALVNYITKAGYPWAPGKESNLGWPADIQIIGKDIVRFHCIYWPAFLLALDIPPPKQILTHAHWTLANQKMAKSTGNVVNPFFALDRFGVDTIRYYLAHDGGITNDSNYGNDQIVARYKKGLQGGIGNLVSRTTKSTLWNIRNSIEAARDGALEATDSRTAADIRLSQQQVQLLKDVSINVDEFMKQLQPGMALQAIMDVVYTANKYMQHNAPWSQINEDPLNVKRTIYYSTEAIRIVGILLQPYMPDKASQILDMIGVSPNRRTFKDSVFGADYEYGHVRLMESNVLFPPLPVEN